MLAIDAICCPGKHTLVFDFKSAEPGFGKGGVPSENLIRWIRSRKENRIMIETDGDLLQTSAWIYVGLLSFT